MPTPDAEPAQPMDVYLLMINCNDFYVGGTSWSRHHDKFLGSSMTSFLRSRYRRMLRKEEFVNRFFYSKFDLAVLEEQKSHHKQSRQDYGEPSASGLRVPKEESTEEMALDLENHRYNF